MKGKFNVYRPQFFKENFIMVDLVSEKFEKMSINQYKLKNAPFAKRLLSYENRISELINSMSDDTISIPENELLLKTTIFEYTKDPKFMKSKNMGEI